MHPYDIVSKRKDGRDASFIRVRELIVNCSWKIIRLSILPNSTSNSSIETSIIETFPKISNSKHFLGNFGTSLSSPSPNAMNLKRRSPKIFVSRLFSKFMPSYPTLMGCLRFRFIRRLGPWTLLTSSPSSVLSAVLKTGGNGGWSTAVVHCRMQYLPRRIDRREYDRASELCTSALALRVALYFCLRWCVVYYLVPLGIVRVFMRVDRVDRSRAAFQTTPPPPLPFLSMPPSFRLFIFQFSSQVVRYGRHVAPVIATHARAIVIEATMEIVEQLHQTIANMASRCVSVPSHLGNTN